MKTLFNTVSCLILFTLVPLMALAYLIALAVIFVLYTISYIFDIGEKKYNRIIEKLIFPLIQK